MFNFEKLDAWNLVIEFSDEIYTATRRFPKDEQFGLRSQLRRAACSISANLAEGSGRSSKKDFARFVEIAFGSLMETVSHLVISKRQEFIQAPTYTELYDKAERLGRVLSGLRRSLGRET